MTGQKIQLTHNILFSDKKNSGNRYNPYLYKKIATDGGGGVVVE
jgi:hypothetical protein